MNPISSLNWIKGLKKALYSLNANQKTLYSWIARTSQYIVFNAEIDHIDQKNNQYQHDKGIFIKHVPGMSKSNGSSTHSINHAKELYDAAKQIFENKEDCFLILKKGTRYGTTKGGIQVADTGYYWQIKNLIGSVENGFRIEFARTERIK